MYSKDNTSTGNPLVDELALYTELPKSPPLHPMTPEDRDVLERIEEPTDDTRLVDEEIEFDDKNELGMLAAGITQHEDAMAHVSDSSEANIETSIAGSCIAKDNTIDVPSADRNEHVSSSGDRETPGWFELDPAYYHDLHRSQPAMSREELGRFLDMRLQDSPDDTLHRYGALGSESSSLLGQHSEKLLQGNGKEKVGSTEDWEGEPTSEPAKEGKRYGSMFNRPSRPASHISHDGCTETITTETKDALEKQRISPKQIKSVPKEKSKSPPSTVAEELRLISFMQKRMAHWKEKLATKGESAENDAKEAARDNMGFNASMLDREDYDQMIAERNTEKSTNSGEAEEKLSHHEQNTAITALLYGLSVLKAATPAQQHDMVSRLMHERVRRLQPALAFEMIALLLELDTSKLLTLSVDNDAFHEKVTKIARAWVLR
ncbi:hypothetical protein D6D22_09561 [Aureobasidium pullulans]|uniref:PABC domain-containing protein n=1 Tax=Aureobasidium pullulans TaxID=5580 RepID=A0A4S8X3H5_AURPU|nr:hypothetical protein D6D22_09561 [Aureobasidium pullulans]